MQNGKPALFRDPLFFLGTWLPALFFLANLYRMTKHSQIPYLVFFVSAGAVGLVKLFCDHRIRQDILISMIGFYVLTGLLNCVLIENTMPADIFTDLLLFGIAVAMMAFPMRYWQAVLFFYVSLSAYLPAYLAGRRSARLLTSSTNYISVLLILSCALYYITIENTGRKLLPHDLLPALISAILSVWARGRGGILSCILLLALLCVYFLVSSGVRNPRRLLFAGLILSVVLAVILFRNINILNSFMGLGKWKTRGAASDDRMGIWTAFFNKTRENIIYFLNGAPVSKIPKIARFNGNTHNSFFQLYANNGIFTFIFFIVLMVCSLVKILRQKKYLIAILFVTIVVRALTDKFIFGQYGMPVMMYLIWYPYMADYIRSRAAYWGSPQGPTAFGSRTG